MIHALKSFIDRTTMYRLVLYYLLVLFVAALAASAAGFLSFSPLALLWSAVVLLMWSWLVNEFFAWIFGAVSN
ncbi:oxidoreductase, partial [bacterium]